jgi:hypothetical protein
MATPLTADDPPLVGSFRLISRFGGDERRVTYLARTAGGNDVLLTLYMDQPDEAELEGAREVSPFGKRVCVVRAYSGPPLPEKEMRAARSWYLKVIALWIVVTFGFCGLMATVWAHFIVTEKPLAGPFHAVVATDPQVAAWASPDGSEVRLLLKDGDVCEQHARVRIEERPDVLVLAVRVNEPGCNSEDRFSVVLSVRLDKPLGTRRLVGGNNGDYTMVERKPEGRQVKLVR